MSSLVLSCSFLSHGTTGQLPDGATVVVPPLTRADWNQGRHYNRMCPLGNDTSPDGRCWAGCTAVATAIVLDYYKWPVQGTVWAQGLADEKSWVNDNSSISLRARFDQPYDWDAMLDVYGHVVSARESLAVAALLADVGAVMNMNYGTEGSSTLRDNVPGALEHNFRFDASAFFQASYPYDEEEELAIQMQLMEGHPIVCAGAAGAKGTGHTYVCDGFSQYEVSGVVSNYYHFNFGWGGTNNGWYPLDAVFTQATASDTPYSRPVEDMLLGLFPVRNPHILSDSSVTGPEVALSWAIASCWTNELQGVTLERQERRTISVDEDLTESWNVRSAGWGWEKDANGVYGIAESSFMGAWPTKGVCPNTTSPVAVSANTTVTITYKARKFPNGVTLSLIRSDEEGNDYDTEFNDYPTLVNLPGGSSTSSLETKTVTVPGATLANVFKGESAYFGLKFNDSNGDTTYSSKTEVFRLVSFTVSGEGEGWGTVETVSLPSSSLNHSFSSLATGEYRFVVTADYESGASSSSVTKTVRTETPIVPSIAVTQTSEKSVTFTVSDAPSFSYAFTSQMNGLRGTASRNGNAITYTFANSLSDLGTHWLTLYVTNTSTGVGSKYVHVTNPPEDHPLCGFSERTVAAASARARREGKLVLLMATGEPDSTKFRSVPGILSSNEVVSAIQGKYVVVEAIASTDGGRNLARSYWRGQPQTGYGNGLTTFQPDITAYAIVVDPQTPEEPYPCDVLPGYYMNVNSRWNYFNSQFDLPNLGYSFYVASGARDLTRFLNQEGFKLPTMEVIHVGGSTVFVPAGTSVGVSVPHDWLLEKGLAVAGGPVSEINGILERTYANGETGWVSFVAGLEPQMTDSVLRALITLKNGQPEIRWTPDLTGTSEMAVRPREYIVEGKTNLEDAWSPASADHRFFHVKVRIK